MITYDVQALKSCAFLVFFLAFGFIIFLKDTWGLCLASKDTFTRVITVMSQFHYLGIHFSSTKGIEKHICLRVDSQEAGSNVNK